MNVTALAILCVMVTTAAQIALKVGVSNPILSDFLAIGNMSAFFCRAALSPMVLIGLALYATSAALWLLVLARAELSYAYPLVSLGFVFSTAYARFGLHEAVGAMKLTGITLIVIGVIFVSRS